MGVFLFLLTMAFSNKYPNYLILSNNWPNTITINVPEFNNSWGLIVYQVTFQNKRSKCLPPEPVHAGMRLIMDRCTF